MSQEVAIPHVHSFPMLKAMVGIGVLCGLLIVLTYEGTLPRIKRLQAEALERAIFVVVPGTEKTKAFAWNNGVFETANESSLQRIYAGYDASGTLTGVAIEASGQGYADIIRILYGYDPEKQRVIGFYVLQSKETPGLGDKIEKEAHFLVNFEALDVQLNQGLEQLVNPIVPVKQGQKEYPWQVDGITGATISSRAIASIIDESANYWLPIIYQNKEFLNQLDHGE